MFLAQAEVVAESINWVEIVTLVAAVVGVLFGGVALALGLWQQKREHRHATQDFLRRERLAVYTEMYASQMGTIGKFAGHYYATKYDRETFAKDVEINPILLAKFQILAPEPARKAVEALTARWADLALIDEEDGVEAWIAASTAEVTKLARVFQHLLEEDGLN